MLRLASAVLLAAVLLAPAMQADVIPLSRDLRFPDLEHIEYDVSGRYTDSDATDLRDAVDTDNDGAVSAAEETWFKNLLETYGSGVGSSEPRIDNVTATSGTLKVTTLTGLTGPVTSTAPIDLTLLRKLTYPTAASAPEHKLQLPNPSPDPSTAAQVLHAPPGWTVFSFSGFPSSAAVSASKDRLTYTEDGSGADPLILIFRPPSSTTTTGTTTGTATTTTATTSTTGATSGTKTSTTTTTKTGTATGTATTTTSTGTTTEDATTTGTTTSSAGTTDDATTTGTATTTGGTSGGSSGGSSGGGCFLGICGGSGSTTTGTKSTSATTGSGVTSSLDPATSAALQQATKALPRGDVRTRPAGETGKTSPGALALPAALALLGLAAVRRRLR